MVYVAGQKVRASQLNSALPQNAYTASDVSVTSSTTLTNATGLVLAVDANAIYTLDGWLYYETNPTADIKFGLTVPSGTTGVWGSGGVPVSSAPVTNQERINYVDSGVFAISNNLVCGGDDEFTGSVWISCRPRGFIDTATTAGSIQLQFAQQVSNGSATKVKAGSWLRLSRLA